VEGAWNTELMPFAVRRVYPRPVWTVHTLAIGMAIARGDETVEVDPAADPDLSDHLPLSPTSLAEWFGSLSMLSAGCGIQLTLASETKALADAGRETIKESVESTVEGTKAYATRRLTCIGIDTSETLHQALTAFSEYLGSKYVNGEGVVTPTGKRYQRQTEQIRNSVENLPLREFGLAAIEALFDTWQRRPVSLKLKRPMAVETVRDVIKRIREFLRWLHRSSFNWRLPDDYMPARISLKHTPAELAAKAQPHGRRTYTVDELCTLWECASPWERLLMILALNCGMGQAEIATLQVGEITSGAHGHYPITGDWIKRIRFKTGVYGEWMLWPETVQAIEWMKRRRGNTAETALVLTKAGKPLHKQTKGGSRNMAIPNAWNTLLARVRKDVPEFRRLSFNKLRKTASSFVRRKYGGEVAGMFLAHGRVVSDELLERYADGDFRPVFRACRHWRKVLGKMFATVADPFPADGKKHNPSVTVGMIKKMKELRAQGMTFKQIGAAVGLHRMTVAAHLNQKQEQAH
jgi:hypothetical protein